MAREETEFGGSERRNEAVFECHNILYHARQEGFVPPIGCAIFGGGPIHFRSRKRKQVERIGNINERACFSWFRGLRKQ